MSKMERENLLETEAGRQFLLGQEYIRRSNSGFNDSTSESIYTGFSVNLVLIAFASELFIKCIWNILGTKPPKEHKLKYLFDQLKDLNGGKQANETIRKLFDQKMNELKKQIESDIPDDKKEIVIAKNIIDIDTALDSTSDTFVWWRYIYEKEQPRENIGLSQFTGALREYIFICKPDWRNL